MKFRFICSLVLSFVILSSCKSHDFTIELRNVNIFQNKKFESLKFLYIKKGKITFEKPKRIDTILDLQGKYVIPPFAEAHTHKLDLKNEFQNDFEKYLNEGVFYVMVLNNRSSLVKENRRKLDSLTSIDVIYANGGITVAGAHPSFAYERDASGIKEWWLPENIEKINSKRQLKDDAYWFFDSIKDVKNQWDTYLSTAPNIVKVYILDSASGKPSLSEEVISKICELSHKEGLRVVAHIETFDDLKIGLRAGVDIFAHLPYYNVNFLKDLPKQAEFSDDELKLIRQKNITIIGTLSLNEDFSIVRNAENNYQGTFDSKMYNRTVQFQKETINHLRKIGFKFAIGSDANSVLKEIKYWMKNDILSKAEVLEIATYQTRNLLFDEYKSGDLYEGVNASFIVLNENPLQKIDALNNIFLMVNKGRLLKKKN